LRKKISRYAKDLGCTKARIVSGKSRHGETLALEIYKKLQVFKEES
jgi:alcohol dehydrogenase